jgi:hypothetical protein
MNARGLVPIHRSRAHPHRINPKESPVTSDVSSTSPAQNLPVAAGPAPVPAPPGIGPDPRIPSRGAPLRLDLADSDRQSRADRGQRRLHADADHWALTRVRHPDGGEQTVAQTQADEEEQRRQVSRETEMGSRKHRRLPRWQGWIPKLVLFFDSALLLYFFAGISNVDWQDPVSMNLAFAAALAGMVTVLTYGFLAFTGHRMRSYKNHAGTVHLDELDGFTRAAFGTSMAVIAVLAGLMYIRIHSEVIDALGLRAGATTLVIPLAVGIVSAVANFLVVLIHALDGSDEVSRLNRLAAACRRPARKAHRLRRRAAQQAASR